MLHSSAFASNTDWQNSSPFSIKVYCYHEARPWPVCTSWASCFFYFNCLTSSHMLKYVNLLLSLITTKLLDFVHRPDFYKQKTQRFGNWICFRLQAKEGGTYSTEKPKACLFFFNSPTNGEMDQRGWPCVCSRHAHYAKIFNKVDTKVILQ
jgi:hypothetical protein